MRDDCETSYAADSIVNLSAVADSATSIFAGWSGSCSGTANNCALTIDKAHDLTATFTLDLRNLNVKTTGAGNVTATGIDCGTGSDCDESYDHGTSVILTASPTSGHRLSGWGGACASSGTQPTCTTTLTTNSSVTATFVPIVRTLTVTTVGSGIVTASGINCGTDCQQGYNDGTSVTLTAAASGANVFVGWGGDCLSSDTKTTCTVTMTADRLVRATFGDGIPANVAFVTKQTYSANLGGLDGADQKCNLEASDAGLAGTYVAWLSTSKVNAIDRLGSATGWVRPDGKAITETPAELASGKMFHPIRIAADESDIGSVSVQTATSREGKLSALSDTCNDFTFGESTGEIRRVGIGDSNGMASAFTSFGTSDGCHVKRPLYCFGTDFKATVRPQTTPGRLAFVTTESFRPGGGIGIADALCQAQAINAGLSGRFLAALATIGANIASRFDTSKAPWVRVDGVAIAPTAADFFNGTLWDSAPNTSADGTQHFGNRGIWSGGTALNKAGDSTNTCNNWKSTEGDAPTGRSGFAAPDKFFRFFNFTGRCNATHLRLLCMQE